MTFTDAKGNKIDKPVGVAVFPRPSAYAILLKDSKVLLVKSKIIAPRYFLPGGEVNSNEELVDGLRRELLEETGLNLTKIVKEVGSYKNNFYDSYTDKYFHAVLYFYQIEAAESGALFTDDEEVEALEWFNETELENVDMDKKVLKIVKVCFLGLAA